MAKLLYESNLNSMLENLLSQAENHIFFLCPYFQLHDRFKDCLKQHLNNPEVQIIVVFGKNEEDPSKSLSKADFEFLKSFPYVKIAYEKRLHAKYYANEKAGLITSLNLHAFSLNNNIEVGVYFEHKNALKSITDKALNPLTSMIADTEDIATEGYQFFGKVLNNAEKIFEKVPTYESKLLGLQKKYIGSKILLDNSDSFFDKFHNSSAHKSYGNSSLYNSRNSHNSADSDTQQKHKNWESRYEYHNYSNVHKASTNQSQFGKHDYTSQVGYCIRTKEELSYDPARPLSRNAYQTWAEFGNPDYRENYCHSCGCNSATSVRRPLCERCE